MNTQNLIAVINFDRTFCTLVGDDAKTFSSHRNEPPGETFTTYYLYISQNNEAISNTETDTHCSILLFASIIRHKTHFSVYNSLMFIDLMLPAHVIVNRK